MKRSLSFTLVCVLSIAAILQAQAKEQPIKIGYANVDYIIRQLPEAKRAEADYKSFEKQLSARIESKITEFQEKFQALQKDYDTMDEAARNQKQGELEQLRKMIENLQVESQESLTNKQVELFKPIYEKIQTAIASIAKENSYTYILNADSGGVSILLYVSEEYNISNLVLKKLGITPEKKESKANNKQPKNSSK